MKKHILMIIAIGLIFGAMFASVQSVYAASEPEGCITFTSSESFSVSLGDSGTGNTWDGTVQVSVDGTDWQDYTAGTTIDSERSSNGEYSVFFRGEGNSIISGWLDTSFQLTGSSISCSGNIENLLDYKKVQNNEHPEMGEAAFNGLFSGCTSLTTAPELPATTLAEGCYFSMFHRCTSLTTAPELPATTLAGDCYESMFVDCRSLTTAPELPATTLADHCYYTMFRGCTSLTEAPELPATTLARSCYSFMFQYCTSLTTAPELPATTLADYCYELMFENCTNLTTAPELPATTLAKHCYNSMFASCSSLTTAPELPATTLADSCYYDMFCGCTSLTTAPELPATTLADSCYSMMFAACMSLTEAPELPATTLADSCYAEMFDGCSSLTTAPELPATTLADSCYAEMFDGTDVKLSEKKGIFKGIFYGIPYRIPKEGDGTDASNARLNMFENTRGPFTGTPELNKTYYLATPGSGIEKNPYIISNAGVWNSLSGLVKDGFNMEGLFFKLGADIEVTEMVGIKGKPFSGSFDGDGHTLTFNTEANDQHCAPFAYTNNAEFKNLHIAGTIKTDQKLAAGLIGFSEGRAKVTNCRSSITIESSVNGDGTHGGFIAEGGADFVGCVFDGALLGSKTRLCGGFLGWASPEGACSFRNCLFAPQELVLDGAQDNQALTPFGRHVTAATPIENCYYTKIIDRIQGKAGRSVTAGQGITVGSENAKEYKVSGITAFDTGLAYGDAFYAEKDEVIPITIPFIPSVCDAFSASAGTLTGEGTSYMLTIPDEDVTLTLTKGAYHKWKFTGFTWTGDEENGYTAAVANYECENDPAHKDTVKKVSLDQKVTKPTCTTGGKTAFTAAVTATDSLDGKAHSESRDGVATNATGHDWGEVTYTWSNDNSEVKAEHACTRTDCGATEEETVAVTSEVTKPPTCLDKGETTYTPGEFKNKAFKAQAKTLEDVPATDHAWSAWTALDENQHQRVCGNDPDHKETGDHTWDDGVVTKEPTIKEAGVKTFTCGVCKAERTEVLPRLDIDPITPSDDTADDTTVDDQIPVVNTAKIMTKGNFTKKQMKLVFPVDKSVTNYRIQYRMAGKKTWKSGWSAGTDMYVIGGVKKSSLCEFRIAGFVKLTDGSWIRGKWSKVSYRYMSAVPLKNAKAGPKCITVTWTKDRKASGYEVKYSLKKSMAGAKTIYVKGGSKTKLTIKKLKSGKRYYVQIRPAKVKSGKKYVGILTNVKAARVK